MGADDVEEIRCVKLNAWHLFLWRDELLEAIAAVTNPERSGRREPRAKKRRPKTHQLLTKPRHDFQEIPHREKYRKAA